MSFARFTAVGLLALDVLAAILVFFGVSYLRGLGGSGWNYVLALLSVPVLFISISWETMAINPGSGK